MKTRPIIAVIALALAGAAAAQRADTPMSRTPLFAQGRHSLVTDDIPPPPGCRTDLPQPPPRPSFPDVTQNAAWRSTLGIDASQARQVQQALDQGARNAQRFDAQRRKAEAATCDTIRGIVGDKAMKAWADAAPVPPPRPPMPPEPPQAPVPPATAQ